MSGLDMLVPSTDQCGGFVRERMEGVDPGVTEYTALRKDGSTFPVLFHAVLAGKGIVR